MKRTTLSADRATWLARTIERNRATYGGLRMMADDPDSKPEPDAKKKPEDALGDGGKKALDAEREARKRAEQDLSALRSEFDGFKSSLSEAFGVKPEKGEGDGETLATIQQQLADMRAEADVLRLANRHKITDENDLKILGSTVDPEARAALAVRLAPTGAADDKTKTPGPRPDLSQGAKGDEPARDSLPGVPRMAQAFEDAINNH